MSEGSPWSRLGNIPSIEKEEVEVPSNDILIIKDEEAENISKFPFGPENNVIKN